MIFRFILCSFYSDNGWLLLQWDKEAAVNLSTILGKTISSDKKMASGNKIKNRVDVLGERYRARAAGLSPQLQAVVRYIHENREAVVEATAMEIAAATQSSDATVVRAVQALGFAGLRDLKKTLVAWFGPAMNSEEKMILIRNAIPIPESNSDW